ncbi:MAG: sulfatase-like hydrolase/transferase [Hungatella sp.]|nr:sulfatase-like hydrolase/transferase [Hungatella sp.]
MKKNLLFVFADQWRAGAMGASREDPVLTPNMDAFCEDATYCDHAFSTFPVCSPHRASLLTGRYPLTLGMFTNCKTGLSMRLKDEEIGMGQALKEAGYQTAYIGKWHLDEPEQNHHAEPESGARDWDAFTPPGPRRHGFDYWYSYGTYDMHLNPHYWQDTPQMICPGKWSVEHETDKAMEYLSKTRKEGQPFALYLSWNPPHSPYDQVPQKYLDLYPDVELKANVSLERIHHHTGEEVNYTEEELKLATRQYYGAVSGLDDQFGRLIGFLKEQGLYDNTIIVLSSDHGDMMGSHGLMGKHVWYEESVRIPFVVRVPGNEKRVCHTCIGSQDMMPTILGLLEAEIPETVEGDDCSEFLVTDKEDPGRVSFLCACPGRDVFLKKFREHGKDPRTFGWRGVRTEDHTYIMELGYDVEPRPKRYLYNNQQDRYQQHPADLTREADRRTARALEEQVIRWMERQKDGFLENWRQEAGEGL